MPRGPKEYEGGIEVIVRTKTRGIKTVLKLLAHQCIEFGYF